MRLFLLWRMCGNTQVAVALKWRPRHPAWAGHRPKPRYPCIQGSSALAELDRAAPGRNSHRVLGAEFAFENAFRRRVLHARLDRALERARAVHLIEAGLRDLYRRTAIQTRIIKSFSGAGSGASGRGIRRAR